MTAPEKETILKFLNEIKSELKTDFFNVEPDFFVKWKKEKMEHIDWMIDRLRIKEMK